jgi:hypothetical protein
MLSENRRLTARDEDREPTPTKISGCIFTSSALGMFGVEYFAVIIGNSRPGDTRRSLQ